MDSYSLPRARMSHAGYFDVTSSLQVEGNLSVEMAVQYAPSPHSYAFKKSTLNEQCFHPVLMV